MRQQRRNFFYAALILLLFGMFGFVYELQDPGTTVFIIGAAVFWLAVAAAEGDPSKKRRDRKARKAFYRADFGVLAPIAPWIPFLLLGLVLLCRRAFPDRPQLAWGVLAAAGVYTVVLLVRMSGFIRRYQEKEELEQRLNLRKRNRAGR